MAMRDEGTEVTVTRTDRPFWWHQDISWPAIVAGAFTALALFAVAGILSRAVGLGWTSHTALTTAEQAGAVIWGGVAALICFAVGGFVAAKVARRGSGGLNGFLVWAVCVPIMMFWLGTGVNPLVPTAVDHPATTGGRIYGTPAPAYNDDFSGGMARRDNGFRDNSFRDSSNRDAYRDNTFRDNTYRDEFRTRPAADARDTAQTAAWWSLVSLAMGLIGAAGAGAMTAAAERRTYRWDRDRPYTGADRTGCDLP